MKSNSWKVCYRHLYLFIFGVILFLWNFGTDIIHMFIGIFTTLFVNYFFKHSKNAVIFTFIFNMGYLVVGSHICNRGTYDINWTTPYCVLCLRMIGLSWDLYDACKPEGQLSAVQKKSALYKFPKVLETLAFSFTPTAFLTGPQFPMRHFQAFIDGSLRPVVTLRKNTFKDRFIYNPQFRRTLVRFVLGYLGIASLSKLLTIYPADLMLTNEFQYEWSFFSRLLYIMIFGQLVLLRYVSIWLIAEGSCVLIGLGCTGLVHVKSPGTVKLPNTKTNTDSNSLTRDGPVLKRRDSAVDWSLADNHIKYHAELYDPTQVKLCEAPHTACANISLLRYIFATNTDDLVAGFNINTNRWLLNYVYKRLRFLGNKTLSRTISLLFLALWHGTHSGYYINFGIELLVVTVENDFLSILKNSKYNHFFYKTFVGRLISSICGKLHIYFLLGSPMVAFYLLKFHLWFPILKSVYFVGLWYVFWPVIKPVVKILLPPVPKSQLEQSSVQSTMNGNVTYVGDQLSKKQQ
ncbi:Lysophospholipid acyltransferase 5 [Schistosoma japonicum]|nr:Lysophospholipid acyltransferase 5 [Schistosoma japonicum]